MAPYTAPYTEAPYTEVFSTTDDHNYQQKNADSDNYKYILV